MYNMLQVLYLYDSVKLGYIYQRYKIDCTPFIRIVCKFALIGVPCIIRDEIFEVNRSTRMVVTT